MNATTFSHALKFKVPKRIDGRASEVYLDATLQAYEHIARGTPVDTGFLRASESATSQSTGGKPLATVRDPKVHYSPDDSEAFAAMDHAAKTMSPVTMGFRAKYAQFVEDRYHMVKTVLQKWPSILRNAIKNADTGGANGG